MVRSSGDGPASAKVMAGKWTAIRSRRGSGSMDMSFESRHDGSVPWQHLHGALEIGSIENAAAVAGMSEERGLACGGHLGGTPVDPFEQRIELLLAQDDRSILCFWPDEPLAVQPLEDEDKTGAVPDQQLQAVRATRAEHVDRTGERVEILRAASPSIP